MRCAKCKKLAKTKTIIIPSLGYGSLFDNIFGKSTKIKLCQKCYQQTNPKWWELKTIMEDGFKVYEYEKEMYNFILNLPQKGRNKVLRLPRNIM